MKKYSIDPAWRVKYEEKSMPDTHGEPHSDSDSEDDDGLGQNDDKSDVGDVEIDEIFDDIFWKCKALFMKSRMKYPEILMKDRNERAWQK